MNFITKIVTTLAILPIIAAPAPAEAKDHQFQIEGCGQTGRIEFCTTKVDHGTFRIDITNIDDKHVTTVIAECALNGTRFAVAPQTHPEDGEVIAKAFCDRVTGLDNAATLAK